MNIMLVAGLCSPLVLVYTLRLLADGKKLERRFLERPAEFGGNVKKEEELLIKEDYATWMTLPSCDAGAAGSAFDVKFYSSHIDPSPAGEEFGQGAIPGLERFSRGRN